MTTDAWITLVVLIATFGVLAFDRLPAAAAMGAAVGVLLPAVLLGLGADEAAAGRAGAALLTEFDPVTDADEDPVTTSR